MKNKTNQQTSPVYSPIEPEWKEEWVPLSKVILHKPFQVRKSLSKDALKRYEEMTVFGQLPPPIKVARVGAKLYLVDGWHRIKANALQFCMDYVSDEEEVLCLVATMSSKQAQWQAARANTGHGVPLKNAEIKEVFKAFIRAGQHIKADGKLMSYREIGQVIGKPHRTIHEWMRRHFPATAAKMGGGEVGNPAGESAKEPLMTMEQAHMYQAEEALSMLLQHGTALADPENRWMIHDRMQKLVRDLEAAGVQEPAF